jgi:hypothetical protein
MEAPTYIMFDIPAARPVAVNPALVTMITAIKPGSASISFSSGESVIVPMPIEKVIAALRGVAIP